MCSARSRPGSRSSSSSSTPVTSSRHCVPRSPGRLRPRPGTPLNPQRPEALPTAEALRYGCVRSMSIMPRPALTHMVEDYVTLIWKAYGWAGGRHTTTELGERLAVAAKRGTTYHRKLGRDED